MPAAAAGLAGLARLVSAVPAVPAKSDVEAVAELLVVSMGVEDDEDGRATDERRCSDDAVSERNSAETCVQFQTKHANM